MPAVAAIAGSVIGGVVQARGASKAAAAQERAADQQVALQREVYGDTTKRYAPYLKAGNNALAAYSHELGLGPAPKIGGATYGGFQATPGYQFQFDQGTQAVNALAGARGGLVSGRTMQDLNTFGQGIANQAHGAHLNRLAGMTDMGQASAGNMASAGNAFATGAGNAIGSRGNAQAAGYIGVGNAINSGLQNGIGAWQYQTALNQGRPV